MALFLLVLASTSAHPPAPPSPPPGAPPCTVKMLKQRHAGDKSWPIACSDTTLGTADKELDLSGAHLSSGDFKDATFTGAGEIKLDGAGLAHADLSGSKLTTEAARAMAVREFILAYAAARDSGLAIDIIVDDFTEANLNNADLSGSEAPSSLPSLLTTTAPPPSTSRRRPSSTSRRRRRRRPSSTSRRRPSPTPT
eukprot:scaffold119795_cov51-Phaeocystis_antarctica.AAC.1